VASVSATFVPAVPVAVTAAPSPWLVLAATLAGGGFFEALTLLPAVPGVTLLIVSLIAMPAALLIWSARPGWDGRHRFAAAAGGLLTYAWHGFLSKPVIEASPLLIHLSHAVFALLALGLLYAGTRRLRATTTAMPEPPSPR
jgi:hypothetical protein